MSLVQDSLVVPWRTTDSFRQVKESIFSGDMRQIEAGLSHIHEWLTSSMCTTLPYLKATFLLLSAQVSDSKYQRSPGKSFETEYEFNTEEYNFAIRQFVHLLGASICENPSPSVVDILKEFNTIIDTKSRLHFCREAAAILLSYLKETFWLSAHENLVPNFESVVDAVKELINRYRIQRRQDLEGHNLLFTPSPSTLEILEELARILCQKTCNKVAVNALVEPNIFLSPGDEIYVHLDRWIPISTNEDVTTDDFRQSSPYDLSFQLVKFWSPLLATLAQNDSLAEFVYSLMASQNRQQSNFCKQQSALWGLNIALSFIGYSDSRGYDLTSFKIPSISKANFSLEMFIIAAIKGASSFLEEPLNHLYDIIIECRLLETDSNVLTLLEVYLKKRTFSPEVDLIIQMDNMESNNPDVASQRELKINHILDFKKSVDKFINTPPEPMFKEMSIPNWKTEDFNSDASKDTPMGTVIKRRRVPERIRPAPGGHGQLYGNQFFYGYNDAPNQPEAQNVQSPNSSWGQQGYNYGHPTQQMSNGFDEDSPDEYGDADEQYSEEYDEGSNGYAEDEQASPMEEDDYMNNDDYDDEEGEDPNDQAVGYNENDDYDDGEGEDPNDQAVVYEENDDYDDGEGENPNDQAVGYEESDYDDDVEGMDRNEAAPGDHSDGSVGEENDMEDDESLQDECGSGDYDESGSSYSDGEWEERRDVGNDNVQLNGHVFQPEGNEHYNDDAEKEQDCKREPECFDISDDDD